MSISGLCFDIWEKNGQLSCLMSISGWCLGVAKKWLVGLLPV